jgi:hypothetical protein
MDRARAVFHRSDVQAHLADVRRRAGIPVGGFATHPASSDQRLAWVNEANRIEREELRALREEFGYERAVLLHTQHDRPAAGMSRGAGDARGPSAPGEVRHLLVAEPEDAGLWRVLADGAQRLCDLAALDASWYGWALDAIHYGKAALNEQSVAPYEPIETHAQDSVIGRPYIAVHDEMTEEGLIHLFRTLRAWQRLPQTRPEPFTIDELRAAWTPERYAEVLGRSAAFDRQAPPAGTSRRRSLVDPEELGLLRILRGLHVPGQVGLRRLARTPEAGRYFAMKGLADAGTDAKQRALFNGLKKLAALEGGDSSHTHE